MYSEEQYYKALQVYEETKSITKTINLLGYPARRQTLYNWINRKRLLPEERSTFRGYNTPEYPRHPPLELKLEILHRCFELGEDVQSVSEEMTAIFILCVMISVLLSGCGGKNVSGSGTGSAKKMRVQLKQWILPERRLYQSEGNLYCNEGRGYSLDERKYYCLETSSLSRYGISDEEAFGDNGHYSTTDVFTFEAGGAYEISSGTRGDFYSDDAGGFTGQ